MGAHEEIDLVIILERSPVAADDTIMGNDGLEDAAVIVGTVSVLWIENYVTGLITDEIFVIRWN